MDKGVLDLIDELSYCIDEICFQVGPKAEYITLTLVVFDATLSD